MIFNGNEQEYHMMDFWLDVFGPNWWIFMVTWWIFVLSIAVIMAYYVHRDAVRRKIPNPEVWLLIVLIFNVLGLIIYLLVRGNYQEVSEK